MALYDETQHSYSFLVFSLTQKRKLALNVDDPTGTDLANTDRQCSPANTVIMSSVWALGSQSETTERKKVEAVAE